MGFFLPRKLLSDSINTTLSDPCIYDCNESETCFLSCLKVCPEILCKQSYDDDDGYVYLSSNPHHHDKIKRISIISTSILASLFLFACLLTVYIKSRNRARRARSRSIEGDNRVEFLDEDHGPVVDHPIWYIRTIGLQPSVIGLIPVCRYKSGDGLVEETECSVCLSHFEEDEALRLLPKCNHAFHVNCIDTWLRSHTNCPLCRAPIVTNTAAPAYTAAPASSASSGVGIQIPEETQVDIQQEHQEPENVTEEREDQSDDTNVSGMQRVRRSVSMDSLSASKISEAVLDRNGSRSGRIRAKEPNQRILRLARSSSIAGRSFMKRSVSCSAKFLLPS